MPVKRSDGETTLHWKGSASSGPATKSDHKHEYIRPYAMVHIYEPGGMISTAKHRYGLKAYCIECGHKLVFTRNKVDILEVEVSPKEIIKLREAQLAQ